MAFPHSVQCVATLESFRPKTEAFCLQLENQGQDLHSLDRGLLLGIFALNGLVEI